MAEFTGKKAGDTWIWDDRQGGVGAMTMARPPFPTHWAALEKPTIVGEESIKNETQE